MGLFRSKRALILLGLLVLILIVVIPLIVFLILAEQKQHTPGRLTPTPRASQALRGALSWPVISRNVTVYASSVTEPASDANDRKNPPQAAPFLTAAVRRVSRWLQPLRSLNRCAIFS